jgi:type I restriction enzyme M protein
MTIAIAEAVSSCGKDWDVEELKEVTVNRMVELGRLYPNSGYGTSFKRWIFENPTPYNSYGNGSAMRVSAVGFFAESEEEVKVMSKAVTEVSHNHIEGIKGAEAVAMAIYLARRGVHIDDIKERIANDYYPEVRDMTCEKISKDYIFNEICQDTVPQALTCFFESYDFEDAIRNGVSIGGDTDTICAIIGGIAEAYFGIPACIEEKAYTYLDERLKASLRLSKTRLLKRR